MDDLDKKILTIVNHALPISERPFRTVAEQVGLTEDEVIDRLRALREQGVIRRVGAVINPRKMGWHSTLCGVAVPGDKIDEYASVVNAFPEVTHNYVREGEPNCWFTIIAPDEARAREIIREVEEKLKVKVLDLPAARTFKIKVSFDL